MAMIGITISDVERNSSIVFVTVSVIYAKPERFEQCLLIFTLMKPIMFRRSKIKDSSTNGKEELGT